MVLNLWEDRAITRRLAAVVFALATLGCQSVWGGIDGRELVVTVQLSAGATVEGQMAKAASCGVDGMTVVVREADDKTAALIGELSSRSAKHGMELWVGVQWPNKKLPSVAHAMAALPVEGLALFFAPPKGEPTDPAQLAAILAIKRQGDRLGQTIRQIKRELGSQKKLALCTAMSEIAPETARDCYVPVGDLIRDGTVDVAAISEASRTNFHRLCLLRDAPLRAGSFLDAKSIEDNHRAGLLSRTVLDVVQNDTCQLLWLRDFPVDIVCQAGAPAVEAFKQSQNRRAAVESSLASGVMVVDQEASEKDCNDQASLHGVAQSFVPSRDGTCPLVQVCMAIRGSHGPLPPAVQLEIRDDQDGKPGSTVLAKAQIPAAEFGLEPAYRWGTAQLEPSLPVKKGQAYWICLTNTSHSDGNYVWRMVKNGAGPRGHAWSKRYDYTKHSWVFRVYLNKEPSK